MVRRKEDKFCKRCKKILPKENLTGFCRRCYLINWKRELRKKRKEEHKCTICGKKVKPIVIYPFRCERCSEIQRDAQKRYKEKFLNKENNKLK